MTPAAAPMTLASFISAVGDMFTAAVGWLSQVGTAIASDGVLTAFIAVSLVGLGVGLYRRLLSIN